MSRLPTPGSDDNTWGTILNDYLSVSLNSDGTLKSGVVSDANVVAGANIAQSKIAGLSSALAAKADDSGVVHNSGNETISGIKTFNSSPLVPTPTTASQAATKQYVDSVAGSGAPDATTTSTGLVQLAGDLGGVGTTATAPVISDNAITNSKIANGAVGTSKIATGAVTSNEIADGTITNADISATAAIAKSKLAPLNIGDSDVSAISESKVTNLTSDLAGKINASVLTAKGDLLTATATSTPARLGVGTDGFVLIANSGAATGLQWAAMPSTNMHTVVTKTGSYTATTNDEVILVNAASGPVAITLPTAASNSNEYTIKKIDSSANNVTVATTSVQTIDGGTTAVIKVQYASVSVVSDGSNWFII
jgi:hypothetical protein